VFWQRNSVAEQKKKSAEEAQNKPLLMGAYLT
jgi:hypothetical protein